MSSILCESGNALNDLRSALFGVYLISDDVLDGFVELIDPDAEEIHENANAYLDKIAKQIVEELPRGGSEDIVEDDKYSEFLSIGNVYTKRYPYLAQVLGYSDVAHEKLYLFLKYLLKRRHLAPTHGSTQYQLGYDGDPLVIEDVPDILATGHVHRISVDTYRNVTLLNCSCWISQTKYQERRGLMPQPAWAIYIDLQTRKTTKINFESK